MNSPWRHEGHSTRTSLFSLQRAGLIVRIHGTGLYPAASLAAADDVRDVGAASRGGPGADPYRVDVGRVVGRYVGETEKNLGRVFDDAGHRGAVLQFDETDALFGRRTEVRDSHDRYANIEVSFAGATSGSTPQVDTDVLERLRDLVALPLPPRHQP